MIVSINIDSLGEQRLLKLPMILEASPFDQRSASFVGFPALQGPFKTQEAQVKVIVKAGNPGGATPHWATRQLCVAPFFLFSFACFPKTLSKICSPHGFFKELAPLDGLRSCCLRKWPVWRRRRPLY